MCVFGGEVNTVVISMKSCVPHTLCVCACFIMCVWCVLDGVFFFLCVVSGGEFRPSA